MRKILSFLLLLNFLFACSGTQEHSFTNVNQEDWSARKTTVNPEDSLVNGTTYLSSYSEIYVKSEQRKFSLTGTISMRNMNLTDTVYISSSAYYGTNGEIVRRYFDFPVFVAPMETVEIIISDEDIAGGTGDNFLFEWSKPRGANDPFFEGIFISTYGQQGISFTTSGRRLDSND